MQNSGGKIAIGLLCAGLLTVAACGGSSNKATSSSGGSGGGSTTIPSRTPSTQIISDSVPAGATRVHLETGPFTITPGDNSIGYTRTIPQPTQNGYIVGIQTNLRYADGTTPPVDVIHLHHGVWLNVVAKDATDPGLPERFFAAGEEKTRFTLPTGYGYKYSTSDHWLLNFMLHNTLSKPDKVWVTYDIDLVPASSAEAKTMKPATPIWMDVQNGSLYPVFDVLHGSGQNGEYTYPDDATNPYPKGVKKNEWTAPYGGTLLATAGHVHPGGLHDDLWLERAGATPLPGHDKPGTPNTAHLFSSVSTYFEPAGPVSWDVSMSGTPADWKVAVKKGDTLSTTATYETKNASWYESMGIMVVWMAINDTAGANPFTTAVDVQGALTHGHLAENDNHGGQPAKPGAYEDLSTLPSRTMKSGSVLPISDFAYVGDMSAAASLPTITEGGYLTFRNDDSPLQIPHTVTACKAPCNLTSGIAYPLANGQPGFDSGELGQFGPPSNGSLTWNTPKDLPPGTYTYFCRIHPFMRGGFRVVTP